MPGFIEQVADRVPGLKFGSSALLASGIQAEFAAHILLQNQILGTSLILRVGSTPVLNQRRAAKSGRNLTKTSNQGLFRGSLPVDPRFSRLSAEGVLLGLDPEDRAHLQLSIRDVHYQNRLPLVVSMQDVVRALDKDGCLEVLAYDLEQSCLRLVYRPGMGPADFNGQFLLYLNKAVGRVLHYSNHSDKPEFSPDWDPIQKVRRKPQAFDSVPDELYQACFNQLLEIWICETKIAKPNPLQIKKALVFATKPETVKQLIEAIQHSFPRLDRGRMQVILRAQTRAEILRQLSEDEIQFVYKNTGLIITSDWDALALMYPPYLNERIYTQVMDTKVNNEDERRRNLFLLEAYAKEYLYRLSSAKSSAGYLAPMIQAVIDEADFFDEDLLAQAGSITPFEFAYLQLINRSYRDKHGRFAHEYKYIDCLQYVCEQSLHYFKREIEQYSNTESLEQITHHALGSETSFGPKLKAKVMEYAQGLFHIEMQRVLAHRPSCITHQILLNELDAHLIKEIDIALEGREQAYRVRHPDYDQNIENLFQHGFAMRKPSHLSLSGAWLMLTHEGEMIYGVSEMQLIETLLVGDFLKKQRIEVNPHVSHPAWARVLKKQHEFSSFELDETQNLSYQSTLLSQSSSCRSSFSLSVPRRLTEAQKISLFGLLQQRQARPSPSSKDDLAYFEQRELSAS